MRCLQKNIFLLSVIQDRFSNETIKFLGPTPPFLYFKNYDISSQIQQKRTSQTPWVVLFRDTDAPTSKKYVSTESKISSFQ